ncbi:hypothetical protein GUJ93_ZPchr0002g24642 [Zizania palustris]|uniref:Uncharacterized protein n=1 Tax=Zizania palustris TaxID=103762 RepID=A0A8J5SMM1_ZIZPA|nr:hypothetical protein GUJ93_ZPchr0002g24642 [Zizania palustris]
MVSEDGEQLRDLSRFPAAADGIGERDERWARRQGGWGVERGEEISRSGDGAVEHEAAEEQHEGVRRERDDGSRRSREVYSRGTDSGGEVRRSPDGPLLGWRRRETGFWKPH